MGYRSDVRIVMSKKGYNEFKKYVKEHIDNYKKNNLEESTIAYESEYDYNLLNKADIFKQSTDKKQIYIGWDNLKWYDGYEDVDAIMDSLNKLEDNDYGFCFSRIGESYDDIEEIYCDMTKKDNIKYQDYPNISRCFEDDNFIEYKKVHNNDKER